MSEEVSSVEVKEAELCMWEEEKEVVRVNLLVQGGRGVHVGGGGIYLQGGRGVHVGGGGINLQGGRGVHLGGKGMISIFQ